jgi:hypothetical protein
MFWNWKSKAKKEEQLHRGPWQQYWICKGCSNMRPHVLVQPKVCPKCGSIEPMVETVGREVGRQWESGNPYSWAKIMFDVLYHEEHEGAQRTRMAKAIEDDGN